MRISLTLAATAALLLSAPAFADEPSSGQLDPNQIICKNAPASTGSRIGARKICMTRREWQGQQQEGQTLVTDVQKGAATWKPPGS